MARDKMDVLTQALQQATSAYIAAKENAAKAKGLEAAALKRAVKAKDAVEAERKRVLNAL